MLELILLFAGPQASAQRHDGEDAIESGSTGQQCGVARSQLIRGAHLPGIA